MTRDELCLKLKEQKGEISDLTNTVWKLKRQYENSIKKEGVSVKEHESLELSSLMDSCSEQFKRGFPDSNSRQRLFWEQQELYANKPDKRGMRWHPMIIRWCLFLRQKSQAAYDAISESGFIKLPSSRTLYDYSHFLNSDLGFQKDAFELAKKEAEKNGLFDVEWRRYVGLLFDEVKIHEDLVYDKHTGELVGYCNLGDIANQMMKFDTAQKETGAQSLAKQVLVVMLRSVYGNMCYPLCAFATNTITSDFLYPLIWQTVDAVQTGLKLRVLFFTCDGASPNRRFFHLHRVGNEELVFRTVNPNEPDHYIYFISDVPHLVKTLRNNLSNSYSHNKSRTLWRNGKDISWMHVVRLFEEHCETSLYNACPRLTRKHVYLQSFNYMKVNLAAQVLSSSVANAMQDLCGPETEETVLFLKTFDKFFDCLNVRSVWEGRNSRNPNMNPYRDRDDPRLEFLTVEVITYLNDWEQQVNNRRGPFTKTQRANMLLSYQTLEGIKLAIHAISSCVKFLLEEGADYVLTNRFNQDPLEQHFGHYRLKCGSNRNPSVYEVRNVLRTIRAVNSQAIGTKRGNTQRDPVDVQTIDNAKISRRK
ncbi:hypothetical protein DPMN_102605 [Dreissena polymorpha]|uniref:Transposase n=2 Tax=Dreissena polymorpha TaxID=45954 RepID=A0A9D4LLM6_DREPO|nr:hypothetical protein DPMN_102605 [Dreissena polymorpha]